MISALSTPEACVCPDGTFYQISTTYAVFLADTGDLTELISNFTDTAWQGASPARVGGNATNPTRILQGENGAPIATTELLTEFVDYSGGEYLSHKRLRKGFFERFELIDVPIHYTGESGPGIVGGAWDTIDVRKISDGKTLWVWGIYACMSSAWDFRMIHQSLMQNINSALEKEGKLRGETIGPFSV
ncbi:hypothetical protein INS49_001179 [Diaporthe citri]|uniref:uncharacterized protein n=1 Tax=Diaporthe citri TaxID=83186 RepID=UPI001C7EEF57|nr:uncharacterized protein INS49_001179 [Diaporthe citri]KAG6366998.1 hypothetical protein INS49_001179 [Diaporthe citri]